MGQPRGRPGDTPPIAQRFFLEDGSERVQQVQGFRLTPGVTPQLRSWSGEHPWGLKGTPHGMLGEEPGRPHWEDMKEERQDFYMNTQRSNITK